MRNTLSEQIQITPGLAGGKPHIAGHRITVQNVAVWHERLGMSADQIADQHGLTLSQVHAALAYYFDNRDEIDRAIREDEQLLAELRAGATSKLTGSPGG